MQRSGLDFARAVWVTHIATAVPLPNPAVPGAVRCLLSLLVLCVLWTRGCRRRGVGLGSTC